MFPVTPDDLLIAKAWERFIKYLYPRDAGILFRDYSPASHLEDWVIREALGRELTSKHNWADEWFWARMDTIQLLKRTPLENIPAQAAVEILYDHHYGETDNVPND